MAKYTELFLDYLNNGHEMPEEFELIEGFEDLFLQKYFDREIGYETETIFEQKLSLVAKLVMPAYAERIAGKTLYWAKIKNPVKTHYTVNTLNVGSQTTKATELPFDAEDAEPNLINESGEREDESTTTYEDKGVTPDELMRLLDYLNKDVQTLVEKCLNEFDKLFMKVY